MSWQHGDKLQVQPGVLRYCLACDWATATLMTELIGPILVLYQKHRFYWLIKCGIIYSESGDWTKFWCLSSFCDKRGFGRQDVFAEVWMANWICSAHGLTWVMGPRQEMGLLSCSHLASWCHVVLAFGKQWSHGMTTTSHVFLSHKTHEISLALTPIT